MPKKSKTFGNEHEQSYNKALGEALRLVSPLLFQTENSGALVGSAKRPDILVTGGRMPPVIIECSYDQADADKDAIAKLGAVVKESLREVKTCVAVHVPAKYREMEAVREHFTQDECIYYAVHQQGKEKRRWPARGYVPGSVRDMATLVSAAATPKEEIQRVATKVANLVDNSAHLLKELPDDIRQQIKDRIARGSEMKGLKTAMVLWLNALLTHQRLSQVSKHVDANPLDFTAEGPVSHAELYRTWSGIQGVNWHSVFGIATEVLKLAGNANPNATGEALRKLIQAVNEIELTGLGMQINIGAELFPKLLDDRKRVAAYYTQPSTAELLAALTIREQDLTSGEWADPELFASRRLADMTCGTGTLLRAGYNRVRALHYFHSDVEDEHTLHRHAMETGLIGTDISPIAAHLTASSLALIGPGEPYGRDQIGWVKVGGPTAAIGSLEYFKASNLGDLFVRVDGVTSGDGKEAGRWVSIEDRSLDWALINPPYSTSAGEGSAFDIAGVSESERLACQDRWGEVIKDEQATKQAGMAASFLALAAKKTKLGGRIGFVLPLTAAFGSSWAITRRMIEREFVDVTSVVVAAGQALHQDALSADTGMEEMLLIGTRRRDNDSSGCRIKCVTLSTPPNRPGEAGELGRVIQEVADMVDDAGSSRPIMLGDEEVGQVYVYETSGDGLPWSAFGATKPELAVAAEQMARGVLGGTEFDSSMLTIGSVLQVGPTHAVIGNHVNGAFDMFECKDAADAVGLDRSLWKAKCKEQTRLFVLPTHKGFPIQGKDHDKVRATASSLFYARGMRWTSQSLLAATTEREVMGGRAWTSLSHADDRVLKAFALWINSTPGMVVQWTRGSRTQAGRSCIDPKAIKQVPCPRLDLLSDRVLDQAVEDFKYIARFQLKPACQAHCDPPRHEIDSAVVKMLGLPDDALEVIADLRLMWCREPSVHGNNQKALGLLAEQDIK